MNKPICVIQSPLATRSGYGDFARDVAWHIIDLDLYDVKLISTPWGACPMNALDGTNAKDGELIKRVVVPPIQLPRQPELYIQITIPNEFQPMGKFNIGITAGIETNMCSKDWIDGCNRMDTVWGISEHAVRVLKDTVVREQNNQTGAVIREIKVEKPLEVLHNCVHTDVFKKIDGLELEKSIDDELSSIKEKFCFLFVGHWLKGGMGEDRKNIALLVKLFCETFQDVVSQTRPALILKTSGADFSILDREEQLNKIRSIQAVIGPNCPSVYLVHGDLALDEMNSLYNHPRVKVHISFTKGEGFGRPLLEASMSEKPIIASGWSGHLDFLNPTDAILLAGELRQVEGGAVWDNIIIKESSWFNVDPIFAQKAMKLIVKDYDRFLPGARKLAKANAEQFSYDTIKNKTKELLEKYVPQFEIPQEAIELPLILPKLRKLEG